MDTMYKTGKGKVSVTRAVLAILILMLAIVEPGMASKKFKHGYVMARSMVLDDNGQPILVEFDEQGNEIGELPIPSQYANRVDELEVVSANAIESQQERHETFLDNNPELATDARILPRDQVAGVTFPLADNQRDIKIEESDLNPGTLSVLIAGQSSRFLEDVQAVVLQEYPFDLTQPLGSVAGARSVVLNRDGGIVATSQYIVAPRVGFYGKDGEISDFDYKFNPGEDEVFGPVSGVQVYIDEFLYPEARAVTDSNGNYHLSYHLMVCPPGGFEFNTDVWAKLNYTSFSPLGQDTLPYYLRVKSWDYCFAYIDPRSGMLIESSLGTSYIGYHNLYVDVMFLTGELSMENPDGTPVPVTDEETLYEVAEDADADEPKATEWYDFDNDGEADRSEIGRMVDLPDDDTSELVFTPDPEGDVQGVYFSSSDPAANGQTDEQTPPDVIRQIDEDREQRIEESTGLLSQINRDDLRNTDVLVFRSATGELVLERQGLRDEEVHYGEVAVGSEGNAGYRLMMRGPMDSMRNIGGGGVNRRQSFQEWATEYQLTEPFRSRDAFHLQPGEWVDIVAINRTTGYIGKQRAQLKSAADSPARDMSIVVEPIVLRPPNLRIWAERDYNIDKGMTQGESRDGNIISAEGAGLQSDQQIVVYSEWLAHDGSALPEGLSAVDGAQYGLTGRLAKVAGADLLQATGFQGELAEFPIAPGRQTQVLQLNDNLANPEHFYIHVIGKARNQEACTGGSCADFDYTGSDAGVPAPLDTRPRFITPILTPHYDEESHWLAYREYRRLLREGEDPANGDPVGVTDPTRPTPTHVWNHRPEYQFSRYSLEIDEINRVQVDPDTGDETSEDIFDTDTPVIGSSDNLVDILYSLIGPEFDRLSPIDGGQDLILALGEEETRIELGEDNTLRIDNLDHLASLDPEDFLTMRLYLNQDAGNVLWEYAFFHLSLGLANDYELMGDDGAYVYADDSTIELAATLFGYTSLDEDKRNEIPKRVTWRVVEGSANLSSAITDIDEYGTAKTKVELAPYTSNIVRVEAALLGDDTTRVESFELGVLPGKPKTIQLSQEGSLQVGGMGSVEVKATIKDQFSNLVQNGTGALIRERGHLALIKQDAFTDEGRLSAKVESGNASGSFDLEFSAGEAFAKTSIVVQPVELEFTGVPASMVAGETYPLTVAIKNTGAADFAEVFIDLGADAGNIKTRDHVTNASGELTFNYQAPVTPGSYNLAAKLDANQPHVIPIEVVRPTLAPPMGLSDPFLIAGHGNATQTEIEDFANRTGSLTYPDSNKLVLQGVAGSNWSLDFDQWHLINREPFYFSNFINPLWDQKKQYRADINRVQRVPSPHLGIYALNFSSEDSVQSSRWSLMAPDLTTLNQPAYNFWFRATGDGKVLNVANGTLVLSLNGSELIATLPAANVYSDNGGGDPDSDVVASLDGVQSGVWYAVSVGIKNGSLYLAVDDNQAFASLGGSAVTYPSIDSSEPQLVLGGGFKGQVAGLRIYDWESEPLVEIGELSGNFDANGEAFSEVSLSANAAQAGIGYPSVSVAVESLDGETAIVNVLDNSVVKRFASAFQSVTSQTTINASELLQQMPMAGLFPDPRQGAGGLVQRTAMKTGTEASRQSVLASIVWLNFGSNYPVLQDKVNILQRYFADQQRADLVGYAEAYLQEATVQASQGRQFWLRSMATGLTVWGELIQERPDLATAIGNAITSRKDFWSWLRILSLPANGWATDTIPIPRPDVTCDKVSVDVNQSSVLAFATTPCRASAWQMSVLLDTVYEIDPTTYDQPELLTIYLTNLVQAVERMPIEYKYLFPSLDQQFANRGEHSFIPKAYAAGPAIYGVRALLVAFKQALRKSVAGAPSNFVGFMQGGTTSRFTRNEMLLALGYLSTRSADSDLCSDCEKLNDQVTKTVQLNTANWFAGLGLAKDGVIKEEDLAQGACTVVSNSHGAGLELVATAMYHALFEFGDEIGLSNPERFEILLADPAQDDDRIEVGLMQKGNGSIEPYTGSPHHRKPDLVLEGGGERKRHWVELKSWQFNARTKGRLAYLDSSNELKRGLFGKWDGSSRTNRNGNKLSNTTSAHRQFFLDYVASKDVLSQAYWVDKDFEEFKPSTHRTWFQIWKSETRSWNQLVKEGDKYKLSRNKISRDVSKPWIDSGGLVTLIDEPQFGALQSFLTSAPDGMNAGAFETSIGYAPSQHDARYANGQVSRTLADLGKSDVVPFNIQTFLALEVGEDGAARLRTLLNEKFANTRYAEIQQAIEDGTLTEEAVEELREEITEQMLEILGPWQYLAVDIPLLSWLENSAADLILGDEVDEIRKAFTELNLPADYFESACETL